MKKTKTNRVNRINSVAVKKTMSGFKKIIQANNKRSAISLLRKNGATLDEASTLFLLHNGSWNPGYKLKNDALKLISSSVLTRKISAN